jgi:hypothetical protein
MDDFPKRVEPHVMEDESFVIFRSLIPKHWIVRELRDRDYGIDCYLELVKSNGSVTGELASIQLKSVKKIVWPDPDPKQDKGKTCSPAIRHSTINYWFGLPTPVFLCVVDLSTREAFHSSVKEHLRSHWHEMWKGQKMRFELHRNSRFDDSKGTSKFIADYFRERDRDSFEHGVREMLINWRHHICFIDDNCGGDFHLEVDPETEITVVHLFRLLRFLASEIGLEWNLRDVNSRFDEDREIWGARGHSFHRGTLTLILEELRPLFSQVLKSVAEIVIQREGAFWIDRDLALYNFCYNSHFDEMKI